MEHGTVPVTREDRLATKMLEVAIAEGEYNEADRMIVLYWGGTGPADMSVVFSGYDDDFEAGAQRVIADMALITVVMIRDYEKATK